jgi:hypothetical protein
MTLSITLHLAECRCAECYDLCIIMLNVVVLNVVMLSAVMLNAIVLNVVEPYHFATTRNLYFDNFLAPWHSA